MTKVIVVGGGWGGCAAALAAAAQGAQVTLLERTDQLLGTGLVGGIMRNNARYTVAEECIALGCGALFELADRNSLHTNISFPGHAHASLYDVARMPGAVSGALAGAGVEVHFCARVTGAQMDGPRIAAVRTAAARFDGDAFVDATGTAGPMANCVRWGSGCAMCILRCPSFGGRVSLAALAGVPERCGVRADGGAGAMSGSCKLLRSSLSPRLEAALRANGAVVVPLPAALRQDHLALKACQQYALNAYRENLVLLDTGHAKLMAPFFPLEKLHRVPGFEDVRYEDPYAGGHGNSMRFFAMPARDDAMRVTGAANLLCAGEKAGLLVGHTEAILTGSLAGYNAVCTAQSRAPLTLPRSLASGEGIRFARLSMDAPGGLALKYTFSGSVLFAHLCALGLYTDRSDAARARVRAAGLEGVFAAPLEMRAAQSGTVL